MSKSLFLFKFSIQFYFTILYYYSETSLQNHILKMHSQLSLHDQPTSSFFNLLATLNKQTNSSPQFLNLNNGNFQNLIQTLNQIVPSNFFMYQCLNCRLYFASNCNFYSTVSRRVRNRGAGCWATGGRAGGIPSFPGNSLLVSIYQ